jgi:hypothetical protein
MRLDSKVEKTSHLGLGGHGRKFSFLLRVIKSLK